jgi:hypothetical protein
MPDGLPRRRRRRPGDQPAELELNHEHAGELGRASDRCRPGDQPAELELNHEHACWLAAPATPPANRRARACRRARRAGVAADLVTKLELDHEQAGKLGAPASPPTW